MAIFPKINGITIKNEKRAAFDLSFPSRTEVDIVAPERDTPGSMATACDMPIISASQNPTFFVVGLARSAKNNNSAVYISLFSSLATFILALFIWYSLDSESADFQFLEEKTWINDFIKFKLGVDNS